jgi:hypothetical protein
MDEMVRGHAFAQPILIAKPLTVARRSLSPEQTATAIARPTPKPTADIFLKPSNANARSRKEGLAGCGQDGCHVCVAIRRSCATACAWQFGHVRVADWQRRYIPNLPRLRAKAMI